ncbi:hypothetical protein FQA39_LY04110 [Lamprigera yunnana]|nr:hypothetical protein FQA39_LY04110 [Lamprigera yunnana]
MWLFKKRPQHLPKAEGKYVPGCSDVMLDYSENGVFFRLYYPTKANVTENEKSKWLPWFEENYLEGLAKALFLKLFLFKVAKWWYTDGNILMPSLYGEQVNADNKLKCIIFSHGYASNRFFCSIICNELASRGYLVLAMEHRDGSACYTYYYKSKEDAQKNNKTPIEIKTVKFGAGHYAARNAQVKRRHDECNRVLDFLINLNKGEVPHNVMDDCGKNNFTLRDLVGRLDIENITIAGHSFGGATALLTLSRRKEIKLGILLDAWMFPIKEEEDLISEVTQPLLFVNTQAFHIVPNLKVMQKFLTNDDRQMHTILGTTHEAHCDAGVFMGYWLNLFMKKLEPYLALKLNNALILRFLKRYTSHTENIEDLEKCLEDQAAEVLHGLTKPWA